MWRYSIIINDADDARNDNNDGDDCGEDEMNHHCQLVFYTNEDSCDWVKLHQEEVDEEVQDAAVVGRQEEEGRAGATGSKSLGFPPRHYGKVWAKFECSQISSR